MAILEKMTFFTQKILFFKIESCLSLVNRFRIELSDTIFEIRKKTNLAYYYDSQYSMGMGRLANLRYTIIIKF